MNTNGPKRTDPKMEYELNTVMLVCGRKQSFADGQLLLYQSSHEGDDDLSYHGSPWYEQFITCKDPQTGEVKDYGNQDYHWCPALSHIKSQYETIRKVADLTRYAN